MRAHEAAAPQQRQADPPLDGLLERCGAPPSLATMLARLPQPAQDARRLRGMAHEPAFITHTSGLMRPGRSPALMRW